MTAIGRIVTTLVAIGVANAAITDADDRIRDLATAWGQADWVRVWELRGVAEGVGNKTRQ